MNNLEKEKQWRNKIRRLEEEEVDMRKVEKVKTVLVRDENLKAPLYCPVLGSTHLILCLVYKVGVVAAYTGFTDLSVCHLLFFPDILACLAAVSVKGDFNNLCGTFQKQLFLICEGYIHVDLLLVKYGFLY